MKKFLYLLVLTTLLVSCDDDIEATAPVPMEPETFTAGTADFSNFVSVGNSLTAGFSDNALFIDGQTASFPNMLATSFSAVGGGSFNIPFMEDNLGGVTLDGNQILGNRLILSFESGTPLPTPVAGTGSTEISNTLSGSFNNMGIPGAKSFDLLTAGFGNAQGIAAGSANPYYARFASEPNATVLADAAAQNPSFFTLWIGNNDILSFATSGGAGIDQTGNPDPTTYGSNDITDPTGFDGIYNTILQTLTAQGAQGVVANIPDVTAIPFFTTVPYNRIPLDAATAGDLNSAYEAYNDGLAEAQALGLITADEVSKRTISFSESAANAVVIIDEDLTDLTEINPAFLSMRQATADDLLLLTSQTIIGTLADANNLNSINGVAIPLADNWVLTPEEQTMIANATAAYNQTIEASASQFDLGFFDANAYLNVFASTGEILDDGSVVTSTYITGGGFSLDGVHPSPKGYALLANQFIAVIEAKYGADLPEVNPATFTAVYLE